MILKIYHESVFMNGLLLYQLDKQVSESLSVSGYAGLVQEGGEIKILGESMDENALDAVILNHVPDFTKIFILKTVHENKEFADDMMQRLKVRNLSEGLASIDQAAWVHHRLRKTDYTLSDGATVVQIDVLNLVISGDIETAENVLSQLAPDNMTESYHWWTQARIDWVRNEIRTYLGWPLI